MKTKPNVLLILFLLFLIVVVSITPYVFFSGFKITNKSWESFGVYLSGISSLVNVMIFVVITFLLQKFETDRKNHELYFTYQKDVFSRFLTSYEKLISDLYFLKTKISVIRNEKKPHTTLTLDELLTLYVSIKTLSQFSRVYISDTKKLTSSEEIFTVFDEFLQNDLFSLISIISNNEDQHTLFRQIDETIKKIETVIAATGKIAKNYLGG